MSSYNFCRSSDVRVKISAFLVTKAKTSDDISETAKVLNDLTAKLQETRAALQSEKSAVEFIQKMR